MTDKPHAVVVRDIAPALWAQLKAEAALRRLTISALLTTILQERYSTPR